MKQAGEEPVELRDNGPAKGQGEGDVETSVNDPMEGKQGAAISSFCRHRTADAPGYSKPTFSLFAKGCGGSAGWRLSPQPRSPDRGLG